MPTKLISPARYSDRDRKKFSLSRWLGVSAICGIAVVALCSVYQAFPMVLGSLFIASLASFGAGGLIGFLFGVPRYRTDQPGSPSPVQELNKQSGLPRYIPNTNLEQISDWLTKLFVGATLVEINKIPALLVRFGRYFSSNAADEHVTVGAAIYFAVLGFFVAFFYAGLDLTDALNAPQDLESTFKTQAPTAETSTVETLSGRVGDSLVQARIALADSIPGIANMPAVTTKDTEFATAELKKLAERYESIRQRMPASDERTVQMEGIVAQMRLVAPAALEKLALFQSSVIAGERLACIVMLQLQANFSSIDWLVDRFRVERPFVQYHAALALRSAVRQLPNRRTQVKERIENALEILIPASDKIIDTPTSETSDRVRVLRQTLAELKG